MGFDVAINIANIKVPTNPGKMGGASDGIDAINDGVHLPLNVLNRVSCLALEFLGLLEYVVQFSEVFVPTDEDEGGSLVRPMDGYFLSLSQVLGCGVLRKTCTSRTLKCINCTGGHRTLAAKCPERRAIIKRKIKERRMSKSALREEATTTTKMTITTEAFKKMPDNYLAVLAATIMTANNREAEAPGRFQYVANEMLKADKISIVIFPESVKKKNIQQKYGQKEKEEQETRKKHRYNERSEVASERSTAPRMADECLIA